ncbi:acyltransferase family protein [Antarctobacter heliothermus]|uniref:Acyltransferase family protein n=1 Tax=Antarctobacter heliothermus TaxID=74033 RepID=A0A239HUT9_9RHOB|nr:acyltransferase [Antarctobacter heliothermus]SNS85107.1 Acyltransferase family protein [Antarctobacter heliothermus]
MKYQPHIDGLRSVAVLPVLIYHLGSPLIPGGYVGVDVFFVISGFLITGILLNEVETGNYSLLKFYKRRILRILPALAAVLIATFFLSHLLLFDAERQEVGRSIVATGFVAQRLVEGFIS